jgi:hypothetical protein
MKNNFYCSLEVIIHEFLGLIVGIISEEDASWCLAKELSVGHPACLLL